MDKSTETDDFFIAQEFYGTIRRMPRYNTADTKDLDTNELDPCLAAKIRLENNGKCRSSTIWVLIVSLIILLTSVFTLIVLLMTWFPNEYPRMIVPQSPYSHHDRVLSPLKIHRDPNEMFVDIVPTGSGKLLEAYNGKTTYWNNLSGETRRAPVANDVIPSTEFATTARSTVDEGLLIKNQHVHHVVDPSNTENEVDDNLQIEDEMIKSVASEDVFTTQNTPKMSSSVAPAVLHISTPIAVTSIENSEHSSQGIERKAERTTTILPLTLLPSQLASTDSATPKYNSENTLQPFDSDEGSYHGRTYKFIKSDLVAETCTDYLMAGNTESGVYKLKFKEIGEFYALCIMEDNEAWMVFQQRENGKEVFYNKTFNDYSVGFGDPASDHWLGLEKVRALLNKYNAELRMEVKGDRCDRKKDLLYLVGRYNFSISNRQEGYRLRISTITSGNFTDPYSDISNSNGAKFATIDRNPNAVNCADLRRLGAWWHPPSCSFITLNGAYNVDKCHSWSGMQVYARERSLQGSTHYKQSHHRPRFSRLSLKVTGEA